MNAEQQQAAKLKADIEAAEQGIAKLETQSRDLAPRQRSQIAHQIERVRDMVRGMRIQLAGLDDHSDKPCPNCGAFMCHAFFICRPCMREVPFNLYAKLAGAIGLHHHSKVSADYLQSAKDAVLRHLKQYSTAL